MHKAQGEIVVTAMVQNYSYATSLEASLLS